MRWGGPCALPLTDSHRHPQQSFLKDNKYDAWLDVSADADPKRLLQKAQLVASSGASACVYVSAGGGVGLCMHALTPPTQYHENTFQLTQQG